jgi:RHS repeat-associated protein
MQVRTRAVAVAMVVALIAMLSPSALAATKSALDSSRAATSESRSRRGSDATGAATSASSSVPETRKTVAGAVLRAAGAFGATLASPSPAGATGSGFVPGDVSTLAGNGDDATVDGSASTASFGSVNGIAVSGSSLLVSEGGAIRTVDAATGAVDTLVSGSAGDCSDPSTAWDPGDATYAASSLAVDGDHLYWGNTCVAGVRDTSISTGTTTVVDDTLVGVTGLAVGPSHEVYVARLDSSVDELDPSTSTVTPFVAAQTGRQAVSLNADGSSLWLLTLNPFGVEGWIDQIDISTASVTPFASSDEGMTSVASDGGYLYVGFDSWINRYDESDASIAGVAGTRDEGYQDGTSTDAWFNTISGLATDGTTLWVGDVFNHRIRAIVDGSPLPHAQSPTANQTIKYDWSQRSTLIGNRDTSGSSIDGSATTSAFDWVEGEVVTGGNLYAISRGAIRKVNLTTGAVSTLTGNRDGSDPCPDPTALANSTNPGGVQQIEMIDLTTDGYYLYYLDQCDTYDNYRIRRTSLATGATSAVTAAIPHLSGLTVGPDGYLYASTAAYDSNPDAILRVDPTTGTWSTIATGYGLTTSDANGLIVGDGTDIYRMAVTGGTPTLIHSGNFVDPQSGYEYQGGGGEVASAGNYLYFYGFYGADLWRLDKTTGDAALVGGGPGPGHSFNAQFGLASDGEHLWMAVPYQLQMLVAAKRPTDADGPSPYERLNHNTGLLDCSCRTAGGPVELSTGNYYTSATDISIAGRSPALQVGRTYNSLDASTDGPFGYGWSSPQSMRLEGDTVNGNNTQSVVQENGAVVGFTQVGSVWVPPSRVLATLTHNGDGTWTFTRRARDQFTFNSGGKLIAATSINGFAGSPSPTVTDAYTSTFAYDGSGRLSTVTDAAGRTLTYSYNADDRVESVEDSASRTVSYDYNTAGDLTDVTDVRGNDTHMTYDEFHRLLTLTDPRGHVMESNTYDLAGRVTAQSDALDRTFQFDYTSTPGETKVTDPKGHVTINTYDDGLLVSESKGAGTADESTWSYTYDQDTNGTASAADPNGHVTTTTWDSAGNLLTSTDPLDRTITNTYDSLDDLLTTTDASGVTSTNTYDGAGNLTETSRPLVGSSPAVAQTTTYHYDDADHPGDITSVTDPDGQDWVNTYDADTGDLLSSTNPTGDETTYSYDTIGRRLTTTSPNGNAPGATASQYRTTVVYDDGGNVTSVTDPLGHETTSTYDEDGNRTATTDANSHTTSSTYDDANQLVMVTRPDASTIATSYDDAGNIAIQTDGAAHDTTYTYDAQDRLVSMTDPLSRTTAYAYDAAGNQTSVTDPAANVASMTYDDANQLSATDYSDAGTPDVTYSYDDLGQRTDMTDGTGTQTWAYDSLRRPTAHTDGASQTVTYGYDLAGNQTSITYPGSHTVTVTPDDSSRIHTIADWLSHTNTIDYDHNSNLTATTYSNSVVGTNTYDHADRLMGIDTTSGATTLANWTYSRDDANLLSGVTSTNVGPTESYTHNGLNQLATQGANNYGYDTADNLTGLPTGATQKFDAANQLCWVSPTGGSGSCGSPPSDASAYAYNTRGDRTGLTYPATGTWSYGYDQANRLTSATTSPKILTVSGATSHNVALRSDGTVWTWGLNANGQLGDGTTTSSSTPIQVPGITNAIAVAAGGSHTLALLADGTVRAWGLNANGELGNNSTTESHTPVTVSGLTGVTAISAGGMHSLALKSNGTVWAWGDGSSGQLGNSSTSEYHTPQQTTATNLGTATAISAGSTFSEAIKSDGTVWTWGANSKGQLGNNATGLQSAPVQVSGLTNAVSISAGFQHALAVNSDGTAWAWGLNANGELGNNSTTDTKVPVQVSGISTAVQVAAGNNFSSLRKSDGTVWSWGADANGRLGDNATTDQHTPVQTGSITATTIEDGSSHGTAVKSDGTVWTWGWNHDGQIGDGTTTERHVATQTSNLPSGSVAATYTYDGDGLRTSKTVNGTTTSYLWDQSAGLPVLLGEKTGTNQTYWINGPDGLPLEELQPNGTTVRYLHQDQIGSTRLITDSGGSAIGTATYDPFGTRTSASGVTSALGFGGQYSDAETGLQYLRARYYDPSTGQFLTRDPLAWSTRSAYGYSYGNPLNLVDPSGATTITVPRPPQHGTDLTPAPLPPGGQYPPGYLHYIETVNRTNCENYAWEQSLYNDQMRMLDSYLPSGWRSWTPKEWAHYYWEHDTKYIQLTDTHFRLEVDANPLIACGGEGVVEGFVDSEGGPQAAAGGFTLGCVQGITRWAAESAAEGRSHNELGP